MGSETSLYERKQIFVDVDGDGRCTPEIDRGYGDYSSSRQRRLLENLAQ